ncbi:MAG: lipocalin family protein [Bacteroidota bacterium]
MLVALLATSLVLSCSKKDNLKPTPSPSTDLIVGKWMTIATVADRPVYHWNTTELVTNLWDREKDCIKDDLIVFKPDNTFYGDEGASKCDASAPQIQDGGTWKKSGTSLILIEDGVEYTYTINQLDDTSLVVTGRRFYIINNDTTFFMATVTYKKQ